MARRPWLTLLALLIAPLVATVTVSLVVAYGYAILSPVPTTFEEVAKLGFNAAMLGAMVAGYIAAPASLTLGWIVHVGLRAQKITNLRAYVLCATFAGLLLVGLGFAFLPPPMALIGLPIAALSGLVLWLIRRPDRDAANPVTREP